MKIDCSDCQYSCHNLNPRARKGTLLCTWFPAGPRYATLVNPYGGCRKFKPKEECRMDVWEAKQVLLKHRPDRPKSADNRQLQVAIDVILEDLDKLHNDEASLCVGRMVDKYKRGGLVDE